MSELVSGVWIYTVSTGRKKSGCQQTPGSPHYNGAVSVRLVGEVHHADIYGGGKSEELFGSLLKQEPGLQSRIILQSKCAIHDGMYDFSREYILNAVDGILQRLNTDYLDILLLHRPDALMEPQDVAEAFDLLQESGKVHQFGVSNMNRFQMELLRASLHQELCVNQLQMSLAHTPMIDSGICVNTQFSDPFMRDAGTLEYCRRKPSSLMKRTHFHTLHLLSDRTDSADRMLS